MQISDIISSASCWACVALFIPIVLIPGRMISRFYMRTSRELTRLESISRSPMLNHFTETLSGAKFIRVFKQTDYFIVQNQEKINTNMSFWLSVRSKIEMTLPLFVLSRLLHLRLIKSLCTAQNMRMLRWYGHSKSPSELICVWIHSMWFNLYLSKSFTLVSATM